ncbi:HNH endonuclease signature motif containing protein [Actinopolymorpha singaporensis]|uniref:HNH nuclease domain-containing protein n=1 Tax=Actinopolymorpha singaporensis TaxID=117157 RepID=A0A1H1TE59_9ACTN|nr:HNH endonuclease signature motif containing protein [Actinopolymorpha singaporensis]SDS58424.1 protein of unknown function [Actinopolymorpha singaporensis]
MRSAEQDLPGSGGSGGGGAVARLRAALAAIRAGLDEALATPTTFVEVGELGELIGELETEKARSDALTLGWVRQAEAREVGKATGAATTAVWLRNSLRMGRRDAYAAVALARDLDRTVTLTARALARGEVSFRHAQVIAAAIKDLPRWISLEQRVQGEEYLIDESRRRNPDDVRLLGRHLLLVLAPEEWERRLGEELDAAERAAERRRSLKYLPNGIPGSETMIVKLPVLEMEALRKIIEGLIAADTRAEPDERPLDQKRGDAFAELVARMAEWQASPNRGRGRDCVTVTIGLDQLLQGTGFGAIDDTTPVRPMPCGCQTPDATRQAKRKNRKQSDGKQSDGAQSDGAQTNGAQSDGGTDTAGTTGTPNFKPTKNKNKSGEDVTGELGQAAWPGDAGAVGGTPGSATPAAQEREPGKEKPSPDTPEPAGFGDRKPGPREPRQDLQPNNAAGWDPRVLETGTEPEYWETGAERDAEPESQEGAAESEAVIDPDDHIDPDNHHVPHDGCTKCGGGGSARILGLRGEPVSVATIRRMACDANIIPVVLGGNGEILDIGTADRFFTEPQRRALAIRDGSHCHFPGCHVPERRCVAHHMTAWEQFGPTDLANGVLLCKTHHTFVHHKGWQVRMGNHGHPEYIPPEWVDVRRRIVRP